MDIQFKLNGDIWETEFQSIGTSSVMVVRQWSDEFQTYYGKDGNSLIKYVKGCFERDDRQNIGFELDIPEGILVKMASKSPVKSCTVMEKIMKTSGGGSSGGSLSPVDQEKLDKIGLKGDSKSRPVLTDGDAGTSYFDTALGMPIYWTGTKWVNAVGMDADTNDSLVVTK